MTDTRPSRGSMLSSVLAEGGRAVIHGIAWAVLVATLAPPGASVAAFFGGAIGCVVGASVANTRLRPSAVFATLVAALLAVAGLRWSLTGGSLLASVLGPLGALRAASVLTALLCAGSVSAALRAWSRRRPLYSVLELLLVAVAFAQLFIPHRNGAINRPFYLADWIIALGWDPTWLFLLTGGVATVFGLLLLLRERRFGRALVNLGIVGVLLALVVIATPTIGMPPTPPDGGGLGLRPEEGEGTKGDKGEPKERQGPTNGELEFRNKYNDGGARVPVAVVLFHDDYSPPSGVYYFRQGAFSQYNGRKLVTSGRLDVDRDLIQNFPTRATEIEGAPATNQNRGLLETTIALMADHTQPFALEAPLEVEPMQNPHPNRFRRVYRATSGVLTSDYDAMLSSRLGSRDWPDDLWDHYTEAPKDPRYEDLAKEISAALPDGISDNQIARAFSVASWLSREGIYSLENQHGGADDPTASFLFGDLTGYCVHFAHAATYLMRSLGVPARVATGYAVSESARQGGSSLLLSGAASHAWPEIYVEDFGWVVLDVYPQRALDPPEAPMDPDLQRLLGELARGASPIPISATDLPKLQELARGATLAVATWALILLLVTLFFLYAIKGWRRLAPRFAPVATLPRVAYRAELDRMGELAILRDPGESRESFAERVRGEVPAFQSLTRAHVASAFGPTPTDGAMVVQDAAAVRGQIRALFPAWKRFLGAATPWSWLRSK
ncbi:MAG: transglutaminase domain-containing protein [Polyangiales bacterium]